jgi:F-type H+-transporting ATPase subunit delta
VSELTTAARPYARAAFAIASDNNEVEQWTNMLNICAAVVHDPTMSSVLDNPRLSWQQEAELIETVCEGQLNEHGKNFIKLLAQQGRLELLAEITALFQHYNAEATSTVQAEVISAQHVDDDQLDSIAKSLSARLGKKVTLTTRIDESLIGGAIITAGDMVIDGSLRGRLNKLSTALVN